MLEKTGLAKYINKLNPDFINNRIYYGWLGKRTKGKVKYFHDRWFVIVSAKVNGINKYYSDESIL